MNKIINFEDISHYTNIHPSKKIIAACGCFDLLHIGHIEYLTGAKSLGDILFVGMNSDLSIYKIKGKYPIFQLEQRLQMIAALECIDYVFGFHQKTFDLALQKIKPAFFARGVDADYKGFPEYNTTEEYNIKVVIIGDIKRSSSSKLRRYYE